MNEEALRAAEKAYRNTLYNCNLGYPIKDAIEAYHAALPKVSEEAIKKGFEEWADEYVAGKWAFKTWQAACEFMAASGIVAPAASLSSEEQAEVVEMMVMANAIYKIPGEGGIKDMEAALQALLTKYRLVKI
jgi:hypothetical protein